MAERVAGLAGTGVKVQELTDTEVDFAVCALHASILKCDSSLLAVQRSMDCCRAYFLSSQQAQESKAEGPPPAGKLHKGLQQSTLEFGEVSQVTTSFSKVSVSISSCWPIHSWKPEPYNERANPELKTDLLSL